MGGLDTSGSVMRHDGRADETMAIIWDDLSPFEQGYVRAALEAWNLSQDSPAGGLGCWGFRHLAPSALARMLEDCRSFQAEASEFRAYDRERGDRFLEGRQVGAWRKYPPLRLYLTSEGKVDIEEPR